MWRPKQPIARQQTSQRSHNQRIAQPALTPPTHTRDLPLQLQVFARPYAPPFRFSGEGCQMIHPTALTHCRSLIAPLVCVARTASLTHSPCGNVWGSIVYHEGLVLQPAASVCMDEPSAMRARREGWWRMLKTERPFSSHFFCKGLPFARTSERRLPYRSPSVNSRS